MFIRIRLIPITVVFVLLMLLFRVGSMWNEANVARALQNQAAPAQTPAVPELAPAFSLLGETLHQNTAAPQLASAGLVNNALAQNTNNTMSPTTNQTPADMAGMGTQQPVNNLPVDTDNATNAPRVVDLSEVPLRDENTTERLSPLTVVEDGISDNDLIDTNGLSVAEVRLLHTLASRRRLLDSRERGLIERESVVVAAERRLVMQQAELEEIRAEIRRNLQLHDERQEEQIFQMREVYSTMAPKQAALIFNELDMDTLVNVISGMSARKIAPIIGLMEVDKARDVTLRLADRTNFSIEE